MHKFPPLNTRNWEEMADTGPALVEPRRSLRTADAGSKHSSEPGKARRARQAFYRSRWG